MEKDLIIVVIVALVAVTAMVALVIANSGGPSISAPEISASGLAHKVSPPSCDPIKCANGGYGTVCYEIDSISGVKFRTTTC